MKKAEKNKKCVSGLKVQSLIFDKNYFTEKKAKDWANTHGYYYSSPDIKANTIRIRQEQPEKFDKNIFRTIKFGKGISAVVACPKKNMFMSGGNVKSKFLPPYSFKNYEDMIDTLKKEKNDKLDISEQVRDPKQLVRLIETYLEKCDDITSNYEYSTRMSGDGMVVNVKTYYDYDVEDAVNEVSKQYKLNEKQKKYIKEWAEEEFDDRRLTGMMDIALEDARVNGEDNLSDFINLEIINPSLTYAGRSGGYLVFRDLDYFDSTKDYLEEFLYQNFSKEGEFVNEDYDFYDEFIQENYKELVNVLSGIDYDEFAFEVFETYVRHLIKRMEKYDVQEQIEYDIAVEIDTLNENGWNYENNDDEDNDNEEEDEDNDDSEMNLNLKLFNGGTMNYAKGSVVRKDFTSKQDFNVSQDEVKDYAKLIADTQEEVKKKMSWFSRNKNSKYKLTDSEIRFLQEGQKLLAEEYKKISKVQLEMRRKKMKSTKKSKIAINYDKLKKFQFSYYILKNKYLLSVYQLKGNEVIDGKRYYHTEFLSSIPNSLSANLSLLAKATGDYTEYENFYKKLADDEAYKYNTPMVVAYAPNKESVLVTQLSEYLEKKPTYENFEVFYSTVPIPSKLKTEEKMIELIDKKAIKEVIANLSLDLTQEEGEFMFVNFKDYQKTLNENGEYEKYDYKSLLDIYGEEGEEELSTYAFIDRLEKKGYLYASYSDSIILMKNGSDFIDSVNGRIATLKGIKYGYQLPFEELEEEKQKYTKNIEEFGRKEKSIRFLLSLYAKEKDPDNKKKLLDKIREFKAKYKELEPEQFDLGGEIGNYNFQYAITFNNSNQTKFDNDYLKLDLKLKNKEYAGVYVVSETNDYFYRGEIVISDVKSCSQPFLNDIDPFFLSDFLSKTGQKVNVHFFVKINDKEMIKRIQELEYVSDFEQEVNNLLNNMYFVHSDYRKNYSIFIPNNLAYFTLGKSFEKSESGLVKRDRYEVTSYMYKVTDNKLVDTKTFIKEDRLPKLYVNNNSKRRLYELTDDYGYFQEVKHSQLREYLKNLLEEKKPENKISILEGVKLTPKSKENIIKTINLNFVIKPYINDVLKYKDGNYEFADKWMQHSERKSMTLKELLSSYTKTTNPEDKKELWELIQVAKKTQKYRNGGETEVLVGGRSDKMNEYDLAKKYGVTVAEINRRLQKGMKAESEHTTNKQVQREIALDHIAEMSDYYDRLEIMEKQGKVKNQISLNKSINSNKINSIVRYLGSKGLANDTFEVKSNGVIVFYVDIDDNLKRNINNYLRNNLI